MVYDDAHQIIERGVLDGKGVERRTGRLHPMPECRKPIVGFASRSATNGYGYLITENCGLIALELDLQLLGLSSYYAVHGMIQSDLDPKTASMLGQAIDHCTRILGLRKDALVVLSDQRDAV